MKTPRRLKAITFPPPGASPDTTLRTSDGVFWRTLACARRGVFFGAPDGEHGVGCLEFLPGTRIASEDLTPDQPLDAAFWDRVRQFAERCARSKRQ